MSLDNTTHILYTRGSVEFYATYPGMYMPKTLEFHCGRVTEQIASLLG